MRVDGPVSSGGGSVASGLPPVLVAQITELRAAVLRGLLASGRLSVVISSPVFSCFPCQPSGLDRHCSFVLIEEGPCG